MVVLGIGSNSRQELGWTTFIPHSCQSNSPPYPGEGLVCGTSDHRFVGRIVTFRIHFHRDVLCVHIILGIQDLLCLWFHVIGVDDPADCDCVCLHRGHLLLAQR